MYTIGAYNVDRQAT